jgi:hypothetical protein
VARECILAGLPTLEQPKVHPPRLIGSFLALTVNAMHTGETDQAYWSDQSVELQATEGSARGCVHV